MSSLIKSCSFINGKWQQSNSYFPVENPATNKLIIDVCDLGVLGAEQAIDAAATAFRAWADKTAQQRSELLFKWYTLILENQQELASILTQEQGKPLAEAMGEIAYSASFIQWFAEEGKRIYGDVIPSTQINQRILVIKQPVGVVTAITPWNFPSAMIVRKAAAALAAGCSFVVRPDPKTPLSALALAVLAEKAGIPKGVFNVVITQEAQLVGEVLTRHPDVAKFTFTGSTPVGKILMRQCSDNIRKISLELGGNAPFIVFNDADIDKAVAGAIASKYRNAGQTCICTNRIYVHQDILTRFTKVYTQAVSLLVLGDGKGPKTNIGPLISKQATDRIDDLVKSSIALGAKVEIGGNISSLGQNFYQATVLSQVTEDMPIAQQEIFGPISIILSFQNEDEVITRANATTAGLAAYVYSENISKIWRTAEQLQYGMVGMNDTQISNAVAPFGGIKQSGFGREGSKYGLDDYVNIKYLSLGIS